jgi:hypothetical protein
MAIRVQRVGESALRSSIFASIVKGALTGAPEYSDFKNGGVDIKVLLWEIDF